MAYCWWDLHITNMLLKWLLILCLPAVFSYSSRASFYSNKPYFIAMHVFRDLQIRKPDIFNSFFIIIGEKQ